MDWSGQVTPLKIGTTAGLGRFPTITEAALIFLRVGAGSPQTKMIGVLALEMSTPMAGFPALRETYYTKIKAVSPMKMGVGPAAANPVDADLCTKQLINVCNVSSHEVTAGRGFMPNLGYTSSMVYFREHSGFTDPTKPAYKGDADLDPNRNKDFTVLPKTFVSAGAETYTRGQTVTKYPYITKEFAVAAADTQFSFIGPELEVEIWSGEAPGDPREVKVQTVYLKFPPATTPQKLPLPATSSISFESYTLNKFSNITFC